MSGLDDGDELPPDFVDDMDDDIAPPPGDDDFLDDYDIITLSGKTGSSADRNRTMSQMLDDGELQMIEDEEDDEGIDDLITGTGGGVRSRRGRGNWNNRGVGGRQSGDAGGASKHMSIETLRVERDVHHVQQALKYHNSVKVKHAAPFESESAHLLALIQSAFIAHGFHRTANSLRNADIANVAEAQSLLAESLPTHKLDLPLLVRETARKSCLLFDDDSAWRSDNLFETKVPLRTIDENSNAEGGTIDTLIERLILEEVDSPQFEGKPDINYTTVFLMMNSAFTCPDVLFSKFSKLFKTVTAHGQLLGDNRKVHLQRRIVNFIVAWAQMSAVDMQQLLKERVAAFALSTVHTGGHHFEVIKAAQSLLNLDHFNAVGSGAQTEAAKAAEVHSWRPVPQLAVTLPAGEIPQPALRADAIIKRFDDIPEVEAARQITLICFQLFEVIRPREFINCAWSDPTMRLLCGGLTDFMQYFEDLPLWVASLIVSPPELRERRAMYARCVRVAQILFDIQNFFAAQAFLNGIEHFSVTRMSETIDPSGMTEKENESLDALRTALNPFKNVQKFMPYKLDTPCIVDIAPYLSEVTHAQEAAKTFMSVDDEQMINWSKQLQVGKVIIRLISFQSVPYRFRPLPIVQRLLRQLPGRRNADDLMRLSRERELGRRQQ